MSFYPTNWRVSCTTRNCLCSSFFALSGRILELECYNKIDDKLDELQAMEELIGQVNLEKIFI